MEIEFVFPDNSEKNIIFSYKSNFLGLKRIYVFKIGKYVLFLEKKRVNHSHRISR
jgi:hypothetical protein